jgi:hypothetical protein
MAVIKVSNQEELEKALSDYKMFDEIELCASGSYSVTKTPSGMECYITVKGDLEIYLESRGSSTLRAESWESSTLRAVSRESSTLRAVSRESSTLTAVSWESSTLRAVSRESSTLRAVSRESSTLTAESWESSTLTAESRESSTLTAESWGSSTLTAESWGSSKISGTRGKYAATVLKGVHDRSAIDIPDCIVLPSPDIKTPKDWCEYHGATVENGEARLYKAVGDGFRSGWGFLYEPGSMPEAPDWDGMERECGGGLHFCSSPSSCHEFMSHPDHYLECWVKLEDLVVHDMPEYPNKIKGRAICRPIIEVDVDGVPLMVTP